MIQLIISKHEKISVECIDSFIFKMTLEELNVQEIQKLDHKVTSFVYFCRDLHVPSLLHIFICPCLGMVFYDMQV